MLEVYFGRVSVPAVRIVFFLALLFSIIVAILLTKNIFLYLVLRDGLAVDIEIENESISSILGSATPPPNSGSGKQKLMLVRTENRRFAYFFKVGPSIYKGKASSSYFGFKDFDAKNLLKARYWPLWPSVNITVAEFNNLKEAIVILAGLQALLLLVMIFIYFLFFLQNSIKKKFLKKLRIKISFE